MNKDKTSIVILLDRSGSMEVIREATIEGFNAFLTEQRAQPGERLLTLVQFDQHGGAPPSETKYFERPIADAAPLSVDTFVPRGGTPLLDAMGSLIVKMGKRFAAQPERERPGHVVFVTITDGHENASREFGRKQVFDMVRHQTEKYAWHFVYLGANQDAIAVAADLGIARGSAMSYSANSVAVGNSFKNASNYTSRASSGVVGQALFFSDDERLQSVAGEVVSPSDSGILVQPAAKDTQGGQ